MKADVRRWIIGHSRGFGSAEYRHAGAPVAGIQEDYFGEVGCSLSPPWIPAWNTLVS